MSIDTPTRAGDGPSEHGTCSLCGKRRGDGDRFVTCYPADDGRAPSRAADDGTLALCGDCTAEVDELVEAWSDHEDPPVGTDSSIHDGYRWATEACSFCDGAFGEGAVLGVEYYGRDAALGEGVRGSTNYSLCGGCTSIFDEFLSVVGDENV